MEDEVRSKFSVNDLRGNNVCTPKIGPDPDFFPTFLPLFSCILEAYVSYTFLCDRLPHKKMGRIERPLLVTGFLVFVAPVFLAICHR